MNEAFLVSRCHCCWSTIVLFGHSSQRLQCIWCFCQRAIRPLSVVNLDKWTWDCSMDIASHWCVQLGLKKLRKGCLMIQNQAHFQHMLYHLDNGQVQPLEQFAGFVLAHVFRKVETLVANVMFIYWYFSTDWNARKSNTVFDESNRTCRTFFGGG